MSYRRNDPATSKDAFATIDVAKMERIVLQAFKKRRGKGANWFELEALTGLQRQTISPRIKPMIRKGLLCDKLDEHGKVVKRPGGSGRNQMVRMVKR